MWLSSTSQVHLVPQPESSKSGRRDLTVSDLVIARTVAGVASGVPGVSGLYRSATAATYGPWQRVAGVVVERRRPGGDPDSQNRIASAARIEVHVTAAGDLTDLATVGEDRGAGAGLLLGIAARIRSEVQSAWAGMGLPMPVQVDIFVDDID